MKHLSLWNDTVCLWQRALTMILMMSLIRTRQAVIKAIDQEVTALLSWLSFFDAMLVDQHESAA